MMSPSAYLRAFVPVESLEPDEVRRVTSSPRTLSTTSGEERVWRQLSAGHLGVMVPSHPTPGWRLERQSRTLVCPSRVRLRSLVGMLAVREQYPDAMAQELVSDELAGAAAHELEAMRFTGRLRTHVLQSNWQIPLRWFLAFDAGERHFDPSGPQGPSLKYETLVPRAVERVRHAADVTQAAGLGEELIDTVQDLADWLEDFEDVTVLQLDYGGLTRIISPADLERDASVSDLKSALDALETGESTSAVKRYTAVNDRWEGIRAHENAN